MAYKTLGRDIIAVLLEDDLKTTGNIAKGHLFAVIARAATGSVFGTGTAYEDLEIGHTALAQAAITLVSGDKAVDLGDPWDSAKLIGYARDKDISKSKSSVDMTVDQDEYTDMRSDGVVTISGNINGYYLDNMPTESATFKLNNMFVDKVVQTASGAVSHKMSTPTVIVGIIHGKTVAAGDQVEMDIQPCIITSDGIGASYGSATSKNMAFQGCSRSDNGVLPVSLQTVIPSA